MSLGRFAPTLPSIPSTLPAVSLPVINIQPPPQLTAVQPKIQSFAPAIPKPDPSVLAKGNGFAGISTQAKTNALNTIAIKNPITGH